MKHWFQVVSPHKDIREGKFDESVFAADLSDLIANRGPWEYRDAETFFRKTYPTQGLTNLLAAVFSRLAGKGKGQPVIQICTPFGGGKTHSLIALHHLLVKGNELKHLDLVAKVLQETKLEAIPEARLAVFAGNEADALKGKTPWGVIADQIGKYSLLKEHDKKRRAPGKEILHELLADKPTLILMDEIALYTTIAKDFREQTAAFFQQLTETVKVLPQSALVVTLPASNPYGEDGEKVLQQLQSIFGRVEAIYEPVEGEEIYEIIRRRLFEDLGDPAEARKAAESYFEIYQRLGDDVPREVREPAYRDRMRRAYPFHPELIDILYERWSTFQNFQRTRGVLRLLAEVVADLNKREIPAAMIQPAHLNLKNSSIRNEFVKHIGNPYNGVIAADIIDSNAKAQKIDREMGSEYARYGIASGLATAVFFGSFSGGEKKGVGTQRLRLALLREGIAPAIVGDALRRLEEELWFLHVENGVYSFSNQPNLNRIMMDREEQVKDDNIHEEIRSRLESIAGRELRVYLWPRSSQDVPDTKELKLAILSPEYSRDRSGTSEFVDELLKKCGTTFRGYLNTLLTSIPDADEYGVLHQKVKKYLALSAIHSDKALMRQLSDENQKTLASKRKDLESGLAFQIASTYRHVAKAGEKQVEHYPIGIPTVGEKGSLCRRVIEYLKKADILLAKISPRQIIEKALKPDEEEKSLGELYELYLKYPSLALLENQGVLKQAFVQGAQDGLFGVRIGDKIYFNESPSEAEIDNDAILVRHPKTEPKPQPPGPDEKPKPGTSVKPGGPEPEPPKPHGTYRLRVKVPWAKLSDFIRGVVLPLRNDGAELEVEINLTAKSDAGFKQATLDHKVRETLNQIGAKVEEDELKRE